MNCCVLTGCVCGGKDWVGLVGDSVLVTCGVMYLYCNCCAGTG